MVQGSNSPVEAIFSIPIQTSPKVLSASCTMETRYLSLGYRGHCVASHAHPSSSAKFKERVKIYLYLPSMPSWACYRVDFTLFKQ
jgi:hypothetical protein